MASVPRAPNSHEPPAPPRILPLQHGEHLTREEFERRYEAMPDIKAELVDGVVYMASPVTLEKHGKPHGKLSGWVCYYQAQTPGTDFAIEASLKLDAHNEPQPDALLYVLPSHGGQARINEEDYLITAPEWAGEVAASSTSYDLHVKRKVYREQGVKEYVVWRVLDRAIDWFVLRGEDYECLPLAIDGVYRSEWFPGLWLNLQAMLNGDMAAVFQALQRGLASPEHQQFVDRLARQATRS